jgi:hypothetical protein
MGADVNEDPQVLREAVFKGDESIFKLLLAQGADVDAEILEITAKSRYYKEFFKILLVSGATKEMLHEAYRLAKVCKNEHEKEDFILLKDAIQGKFGAIPDASAVKNDKPVKPLGDIEADTDTDIQEVHGNTPGNINNGGFVAIQDEWVYYSNKTSYGDLYKMRTDGTGKQRLTDEKCEYINVAGDWVYYQNLREDGKLYRIRTDGTGRQKLTDDKCKDINVVGDWVYYTVGHDRKLCRVRTDGTDRQYLTDEGCANINVAGNWVYYIRGSSLYRVRTDGKVSQKLNYDDIMWVNVAGDWVYYQNWSDKHNLYRVRTDETDRQKLDIGSSPGYHYHNDITQFCGRIIVAGDWVYYTSKNLFGKFNLCRIRTDGTGTQKLNKDDCDVFNVAGDWVYYINESDKKKLYRVRTDGTGREAV